MASSKSGAGYGGAAELRRRGESRPGGLCRCMPPPQPEERRHQRFPALSLDPGTGSHQPRGKPLHRRSVPPAPPARSRGCARRRVRGRPQPPRPHARRLLRAARSPCGGRSGGGGGCSR